MRVLSNLVLTLIFTITSLASTTAIADEIPGRQYVQVGDYKVAYREWGQSGKPVLFIHGIPLNTSLWHKVGPLLAEQGYHVYAPGQLGLSYTEGPADADHSLLGQAEIMTQFAEQVIGQPYLLFGHDTGGGVAQVMVTHATTKGRNPVEKIVIGNAAILDMWPVPEANAVISEARKPNPENFFTKQRVHDTVMAFAANGLMEPKKTLTPQLKADMHINYAANPKTRAHFVQYLKAMDSVWTEDASPKMTLFDKPAMLLWGIHDQFQPPYISGVALAQIMPHATWRYLEASHFYPLEVPEAVVDAFVSWEQNK